MMIMMLMMMMMRWSSLLRPTLCMVQDRQHEAAACS
jgi:hypothetical protein